MLKLKINIDLLQHKEGSIITLQTDKEGNVLDNFWARRLADSEIDNCVEIVSSAKNKKKG